MAELQAKLFQQLDAYEAINDNIQFVRERNPHFWKTVKEACEEGIRMTNELLASSYDEPVIPPKKDENLSGIAAANLSPIAANVPTMRPATMAANIDQPADCDTSAASSSAVSSVGAAVASSSAVLSPTQDNGGTGGLVSQIKSFFFANDYTFADDRFAAQMRQFLYHSLEGRGDATGFEHTVTTANGCKLTVGKNTDAYLNYQGNDGSSWIKTFSEPNYKFEGSTLTFISGNSQFTIKMGGTANCRLDEMIIKNGDHVISL